MARMSSQFVSWLRLEDAEGSKKVNWRFWFSYDIDFEFIFKKYGCTVFQATNVLQQKDFIYMLPVFVCAIFFSVRMYFFYFVKVRHFLAGIKGQH